jgi:hypothetical protein
MTAADRAREMVGSQWDQMDTGTRVAITMLAGEMDRHQLREDELKDEIVGLRKILYTVLGTIVAAAIADGVLTFFN